MMPVRLQEPVRSRATVEPGDLAPGVVEYAVGPAVTASALSLGLVEMAAGASMRVRHTDVDEVLYALGGSVRADVEGESLEVDVDSALRLAAGEEAVITASDAGARLLRAYAGPSADVHAPLGAPERVVVVDKQDVEDATSDRSYRVLFGPDNGFVRGTLFLGVVPPGAAPWHFHQYEELLWIHRGRTVFHQAGGTQEMEPGCVVRISARAPHINENPGDDDVLVIGLISPASSPSAAYLAQPPHGRLAE